jgi:hypothetical protein
MNSPITFLTMSSPLGTQNAGILAVGDGLNLDTGVTAKGLYGFEGLLAAMIAQMNQQPVVTNVTAGGLNVQEQSVEDSNLDVQDESGLVGTPGKTVLSNLVSGGVGTLDGTVSVAMEKNGSVATPKGQSSVEPKKPGKSNSIEPLTVSQGKNSMGSLNILVDDSLETDGVSVETGKVSELLNAKHEKSSSAVVQPVDQPAHQLQKIDNQTANLVSLNLDAINDPTGISNAALVHRMAAAAQTGSGSLILEPAPGDANKLAKESNAVVSTRTNDVELAAAVKPLDPSARDTGLTAKLSGSQDMNTAGNYPELVTVKELAQDIKMELTNGKTEMRLQLKPEHLGDVSVKVSFDADTVSMAMKTDNVYAKQLLETNFAQLKDAMSSHGLQIDNFSVDVNQQGTGRFGNEERSQHSSQTQEERKQDDRGRQQHGEAQRPVYTRTNGFTGVNALA